MKTVYLECGCDVEWKEWGGQGQEDFPFLGRIAWCKEHGDQEIEDLDPGDYNIIESEEHIVSGDGGHQTPAGASGMAYAAGSRLHIWSRPDTDGTISWFYCFSGVSRCGNYYESDDVGPFTSREEVEESANIEIEESAIR